MQPDPAEPDFEPSEALSDELDQRPDEDELAIEQELLDHPGVQAATLVADEWIVYLRRGSEGENLPATMGDRRVRVEYVG